MADFEGTWDVEEHTFRGNRTLKDKPVRITIEKNATTPTQYDVKIPLQGGKLLSFTKAPNGQIISDIVVYGKDTYEVRLVFNHKVNPAQILGEAGGSFIARWPPQGPHALQPEDMGTITGTRG